MSEVVGVLDTRGADCAVAVGVVAAAFGALPLAPPELAPPLGTEVVLFPAEVGVGGINRDAAGVASMVLMSLAE